MLRAVGVAERRGRRDVVDEHDRRLASVEGLAHAIARARVSGSERIKRPRRRLREVGRIGDEHGGGQLVVLGLADQVGGDEARVGGPIGDHEDLGRAGLGVDAHDPAHQPLGRGDVDVAGARDQIDRVEAERRHAVGERADRAGAAHRVDLVDAEDAGGAQDRRVHAPVVLGLRRRRERDRLHARDLRRHDVHDDARRVDRLAAGHVEADPLDRLPALDDLGAGAELGDGGRRHLRLAGPAHPRDGLLERGADGGIEGAPPRR